MSYNQKETDNDIRYFRELPDSSYCCNRCHNITWLYFQRPDIRYLNSFFMQTISISPLQVYYYLEALPTQHGYCAGVSRRRAKGNCELRICPRSIHGGWSEI